MATDQKSPDSTNAEPIESLPIEVDGMARKARQSQATKKVAVKGDAPSFEAGGKQYEPVPIGPIYLRADALRAAAARRRAERKTA